MNNIIFVEMKKLVMFTSYQVEILRARYFHLYSTTSFYLLNTLVQFLAKHSVTKEIIEVVSYTIDIPIIVGGGIKTPASADLAVKSGASIIVTGTAIEKNSNCMEEFANAIHWKG